MRDVLKFHQCECTPVDASWNGTTTHTGLIQQPSSSSGMFTKYSE